ncbi:hypothetical protein GCM10010112_26040 [Actinoplanes lobatus]|uniref:SseB protein N-terminal domain-containing protein n=1 Tax=Actinoplanes lobatus TaxID=113568 RepID=A0A7W7HJH3_9ACTN|nr:SseB family protein [Actinoplanes lobatus]MBB4751645.1 hypothetical protein [Actinoplanes lobatus]GGN65100.1 hypothetical protein GCM10010112_26040 [Actinoplanes lobatus]GIE43229.1 hypothetical protein Alo02nite_61270 [Actinoplanes lobatus]
MSDTPLSDVMAEHVQGQDQTTYGRFVALFRTSTVGVVVAGTPVQDNQGRLMSDGTLRVGRTAYGDGQSRILTFADPEAFIRNYGPRFNAGVSGEDLLRIAASDPECRGILVNSAIEENSIVIDRETAAALTQPPSNPRKSLWGRFRRSAA